MEFTFLPTMYKQASLMLSTLDVHFPGSLVALAGRVV